MTVFRNDEYFIGILKKLQELPNETEWVEFKQNNSKPEEIGEYISALSNSAALLDKVNAYIIWGVDDKSHEVVGTNFDIKNTKIGNEELESWLLKLLSPKLDFRFYELVVDNLNIVLLEIGTAFRHPVQFKTQEYIRIGSYKKKLKDYPEKERKLWQSFEKYPFEDKVAAENITAEEVLHLLDYTSYFDLMDLPLPENREGIFKSLKSEDIITESDAGLWNITNMGSILFAKKLSSFRHLRRKPIRVILYKDNTRLETVREEVNERGYASGYEELIKSIIQLLPKNEVIGQAFRKEVPMFPELAIRELVANAVIHQDFQVKGTSVMIEIFSDRLELINPGLPLIQPERFLDSPPKSRNEAIASFMRRIGVCEERGSGIDKVVIQTENYQLPAPIFRITDEHTQVILFAHKELKRMDKTEKSRACYLHAALRYVQNNFMTNTTLRERFNIDVSNSAIVSRIIKDAIESGLIHCYDESVGTKARKYIPWWAS